jgi:hypothetical protein
VGSITFDADLGTASGSTITIHALGYGGTAEFYGTGSTLQLFANLGNSGNYNTGWGFGSLLATGNGNSNSAFGTFALPSLNTAVNFNCAFGFQSLQELTAGQYNIGIGASAGQSYTGSESSNIIIGHLNLGTLGESHVLRIGVGTGTSAGYLNKAYIQGITGATPVTGNTPQVVLCDNGGNLAVISSSTTNFVLTSNGTATPSFKAPAASSISITGDSGGALSGSAFTLTGGSTGLTLAGSGTTETLGGILVGANGGTGANNTTTGTGTILRSNGTAFVPTTTTFPNTNAINTLLYASAANVMSALSTGNNGVLITSASGVPSILADGTTGQVLTATTGSPPAWANAAASSITANGDSGSASGSTITWNANSNSGSSVKFTATGSTVSLNVTDANDNTILGASGGNGSISGTANSGFGFATLNALTSGSNNMGVGYATLDGLKTGSNNVAIGPNSGTAYTGAESSNILFNATGTVGESNVLRLGSATGTSATQLSKAFIFGITGVTPTNIQPVSINSSTGQLGVTPSVATNFGTSAAPTGTTSTAAYVMMGLGSSWKITPTTFTSVRATINGQMANSTTGDGINIIVAYGTGTAPSNGASVTGTTVGINTIFTDLTGLLTNGAPFCKNVIITGLTPGTAYWIDIQCKAVTGGTASILNLEFSAQELTS